MFKYLIVFTNHLKSAQLNSQMIINGLIVSLPGLERSLQSYLQSGTEEPFSMKTVPVMAVKEEPEKKVAAKKKEPNKQDIYAEEISRIPEFAQLGPLFKSSIEQKLTEAETEYQISVVKHTFGRNILLQFNCQNTLNDQVLHDLTIEVEGMILNLKLIKCFFEPSPSSRTIFIEILSNWTDFSV